MATEAIAMPDAAQAPKGGDLVRRHALVTRLWHWTNAVALIVLLMSGLMIFNAHPRLYWGQYGANFDPAWFEIGARTQSGGFLRFVGWEVNTDGWLGRWPDKEGVVRTWAFPWWMTIPSGYSLSDARLWHFFFAWVLSIGLTVHMAAMLMNGHVRDFVIRLAEIRPSHLWHDIRDHARLRFSTGVAALRYNILQKLSYVGVIFVALPVMILTGLTMSPGMNAAWPWLLDIFGGRQSARSIHFIVAWALVAFFLVHILMVVLAGPINEVRSMITGRYRLPKERGI